MRPVLSLLLVLTLAFFSACTHKPIVPRTTFSGEYDNGETILIQVGGTLNIELDAKNDDNAQWTVKEPVPSQVKLFKGPIHRAYTDALGSGNTTYFEFKIVASGEGTLTLAYVKKDTGETLKTWTATISAKEANDVFKGK